MAFKIGFKADIPENTLEPPVTSVPETAEVRPSVVDIHFPHRNLTCTYYNDRFDLRKGDIVYVDGKLEGYRGHVVGVSHNFKIKLSDYKRVIGVVDANIKGEFHMTESHFITFDPEALPREKARTWFKAPPKDEEEYATGSDGSSFALADLKSMGVSPAAEFKGTELYDEGSVAYISLAGDRGYAIVEGGDNYEIEFTYKNGEISGITCGCYCSENCKHIYAAMLQLKDILEVIEGSYADEYEHSGYFAAVCRYDLLNIAVKNKKKGSITLG